MGVARARRSIVNVARIPLPALRQKPSSAIVSIVVFLAIPCALIYTASMDRSSDLSGIAAMLAATAFFVVGDSFMKLVTEDLPPFEVLFLRSIAASLACAVLVALRGDRRGISGVLNLRALLRAAGETLCTLCYVVALARMPIADVIAILQTGPLILILGAAFLLRERIGPARVALALVGFAGALMVAQPSPSGVPPAALLALGLRCWALRATSSGVVCPPAFR